MLLACWKVHTVLYSPRKLWCFAGRLGRLHLASHITQWMHQEFSLGLSGMPRDCLPVHIMPGTPINVSSSFQTTEAWYFAGRLVRPCPACHIIRRLTSRSFWDYLGPTLRLLELATTTSLPPGKPKVLAALSSTWESFGTSLLEVRPCPAIPRFWSHLVRTV